jgi:hypothetical protein
MNKSPESLYLPNSTEKINLIDLVIDSKNLQIIPISLEYRFDIFREFTKEITIYMFPQEFKNINETDNFIMKSQIGLVM